MPYAVNKEKGIRAPIEYYCEDCSFTTFDQLAEQEHYAQGHFTRSRVREDLEEKIPNEII